MLSPLGSHKTHARKPKGRLHHGPLSWTTKDGLFSKSDFLKTSICKVFGPFTRCKPNVDQEE